MQIKTKFLTTLAIATLSITAQAHSSLSGMQLADNSYADINGNDNLWIHDSTDNHEMAKVQIQNANDHRDSSMVNKEDFTLTDEDMGIPSDKSVAHAKNKHHAVPTAKKKVKNSTN